MTLIHEIYIFNNFKRFSFYLMKLYVDYESLMVNREKQSVKELERLDLVTVQRVVLCCQLVLNEFFNEPLIVPLFSSITLAYFN